MNTATDHVCYKTEEDVAFQEVAKRENYQNCYKCGSTVEIIDACNHITCRCGANFCYICGCVWKGPHECPYYNAPRYDEEGYNQDGYHRVTGVNRDGETRNQLTQHRRNRGDLSEIMLLHEYHRRHGNTPEAMDGQDFYRFMQMEQGTPGETLTRPTFHDGATREATITRTPPLNISRSNGSNNQNGNPHQPDQYSGIDPPPRMAINRDPTIQSEQMTYRYFAQQIRQTYRISQISQPGRRSAAPRGFTGYDYTTDRTTQANQIARDGGNTQNESNNASIVSIANSRSSTAAPPRNNSSGSLSARPPLSSSGTRPVPERNDFGLLSLLRTNSRSSHATTPQPTTQLSLQFASPPPSHRVVGGARAGPGDMFFREATGATAAPYFHQFTAPPRVSPEDYIQAILIREQRQRQRIQNDLSAFMAARSAAQNPASTTTYVFAPEDEEESESDDFDDPDDAFIANMVRDFLD